MKQTAMSNLALFMYIVDPSTEGQLKKIYIPRTSLENGKELLKFLVINTKRKL